jgi:pilus assembly protein FimV
VSVDRTKVLEAAQKHLAKGAFDKAIIEFQKLVKADPGDVRTWLKIGDLYAKKGATKEAVDTYSRVADQYAAQGFFEKVVAVRKQIFKLDPSRLDVQLKLAEAYENLQLISDALTTYEQVAGQYARAGNIDKALSTLAKMVALDPDNIPVRIKYAEALSKANRTKEAADAFEAGGRLLKAQGRIDDWIKVAERLLFHRADDVGVARELSKLYLDRNDAKRALAKLQICFKADPKDVPTLEMLAEAFRQLGQLPKTISVYREVARIHQEANRGEDRARTLKRILELDPADAEARQALAAYAQPEPAPHPKRDIVPPSGAVVIAPPSGGGVVPPAAARGPAPQQRQPEVDNEEPELEELDEEALEDDSSTSDAPEAFDDRTDAEEHRDDYEDHGEYAAEDDGEQRDEDVIIVDDDDGGESEPEVEPAPVPLVARRGDSGAPAGGGSATSLPPEIAREAQIAKLLTECEVFLRYGLKQKVLDQLRRVIDLDPTHVGAHERLKDLLIDRGDIPGAIAQLVVLADLFRAQRPPVATLYLREILELDPDHDEARARLEQMGASLDDAPRRSGYPSSPVSAESTAPEITATSIDTEEGGGEDSVFFVDDDEGARSEAPRPRAAMPPPPSVEAELPSSMEMQPGEPEPEPGAADDDLLAPMSPEEFESAPLHSSAPAPGREAARASMPPGEVEELLDEADFFVAQGLYEEAKAMLRDSGNAHPGNRLIADKLAEVEEIAAQHASQARAVAPAEDHSFELAEKLAEEIGDALPQASDPGSDVLDVEQVFAQFKKGVEQQVGLEDTETHFDLGIAYKEMGLIQDAMAEFRLCLVNPQKQCIAHTMIGLCSIEKGEVAEAISHFKKGLYSETKTDREELGLYFELGRAYEMLHDPKEALYYFEKVRKRDPAFRSVNDRIIALSRPTPESTSSQSASIANDDIDAAFDDLMGDRES